MPERRKVAGSAEDRGQKVSDGAAVPQGEHVSAGPPGSDSDGPVPTRLERRGTAHCCRRATSTGKSSPFQQKTSIAAAYDKTCACVFLRGRVAVTVRPIPPPHHLSAASRFPQETVTGFTEYTILLGIKAPPPTRIFAFFLRD